MCPPGDDRAAIAIIVAVAFILLVMPISLDVLGDIVCYIRGH